MSLIDYDHEHTKVDQESTAFRHKFITASGSQSRLLQFRVKQVVLCINDSVMPLQYYPDYEFDGALDGRNNEGIEKRK